MRNIILSICLILQIISNQVNGQIGITICACQPSIYTFQINFTSICKDTNIVNKPGIKGTDCFQRGIGINAENINDTIPIQINTINIIELNSKLLVISQTSLSGDYRNNDIFNYTSTLVKNSTNSLLTSDTLPAALQLNMVGINQLFEPITNVWIILFDNNCGFYPILDRGDNIGWTTLVSKNILVRKKYIYKF